MACDTLSLAWVMGMTGDCPCSGYQVEEAGVNEAAEPKTLCNPGQLCQQWVAAIPSWEGQVPWVLFCRPCLILSMAVSEFKVK